MEENKKNIVVTTIENDLPEFDGYDDNGGYWVCTDPDCYDPSYDKDIIAEEILYRRAADRIIIDAVNLLTNQYLSTVSELLGLDEKETSHVRDALAAIVKEKKKKLYSENEE